VRACRYTSTPHCLRHSSAWSWGDIHSRDPGAIVFFLTHCAKLQALNRTSHITFKGFFVTESRHHMVDANYLSAWFPKRAGERCACLDRIVKATQFWLGTPAPPRSP
jgi:hypothetical protein